MKRLRSNMTVYEVYVDDEFYKMTISEVIKHEFKVQRHLANKTIKRGNKTIYFKKVGTIKDYLEYALYRGDKLIAIDTIENLANTINVKLETMHWYLCHANKTNTTCERVGLSLDIEDIIDIGNYVV